MKNKYYFFDPKMVKNIRDAELILGKVYKTSTAASWVDQYAKKEKLDVPDWEHRVSIMYPYVVYDENGIGVDGHTKAKYKIWYHSWYTESPTANFDWRENIIDKSNSKNVVLSKIKNTAKGEIYAGGHVVCYMESADGINWQRPDCGEFLYRTQSGKITGTNIVFIGCHGPGINLNIHPEAGKSEPLFLLAGQSAETEDEGVAISWSCNGIHWEAPITVKSGNTTEIHMKADTHNQIMWVPELNRYVIISRGLKNLRTVLRMESSNELQSLTALKDIKEKCTSDSYWTQTGKLWSEPQVVYWGEKSEQTYSMPIARIGNGYYIGIASIANFDSQVLQPRYQSVYAQLLWSRDTKEWYPIKKNKPFIANSDEFSFEKGNDYGMIYSAPPVVTDSEIKFFYAALPELHYFKYDEIPINIRNVVDVKIFEAKRSKAITRTATLNVGSIKMDRYAGYESKNGEIESEIFMLKGPNVTITADVRKNGMLTAAICDSSGSVIESFGHNDLNPIVRDITDQEISWNGDINSLIGKDIYLQIKLKNAVLYTLGGDIEKY